ncbi:hypothetical protein LTR35_008106 [Friedmanniomyces endolithicus]|nr:hypothetical protein LTR35_008106 [Friedmanniomyces endolithicus]KAK0282184.1 hypothetical protein LTS00_012299 [Friedmanniomyces endolithicus]KAK1017918.1 hypothetical protein LTR54_001764 [Friedmanniomyces endolithicus]
MGLLVKGLRFQDVSDPPDKIYGLLRLCSRLEELPGLLVPDYDRPVRDVYRDAARFLIQSSEEGLGVLRQVRHIKKPDTSATAFPSWVPFWDRSGSYANDQGSLLSYHTDHSAHANTIVEIHLATLGDLDVLEVSGLLIDTIVYTDDSFQPAHLAHSDDGLRSDTASGRRPHVLRRLWEVAVFLGEGEPKDWAKDQTLHNISCYLAYLMQREQQPPALAVIERQDRRQARQDLLYEHSVQHIVKLEQAVSRAHAAQAVAISERDAACARIGELEKQEARRLEETAGEAKRLEQQSREHCGKITAQQIEIAGLKADLTTETEKSGTVATELQGEKTVVRALEQKLGASQQLCAEKETECQKLFINSKSLRAQIEQLEGNRGASGALCQMEDAETERLNALDGNEQVEQRSWVGDAEIPDPWEWSRRSLTDFSSSWKRTGIDRESAPEASNEDSASLCSSVEVVIATQHDPSPVREDSEDSIATHRDPSPTYEDSDVSIAAQRDPSPNGEITEDSIATPRDPSPSTIEQEPVHATPQATSLPSNPPISTLTARVADFVPFGSSNPFSTTSTTFSSGAQGSSAQGTTTKKTRRTQRGGRNRRKPKDAAAAGAGEQDEGADGNGDGEEAPGSISSTPSGRATSMPTANNNAQAPRLPGLQFWNPNGLMASRHAQH